MLSNIRKASMVFLRRPITAVVPRYDGRNTCGRNCCGNAREAKYSWLRSAQPIRSSLIHKEKSLVRSLVLARARKSQRKCLKGFSFFSVHSAEWSSLGQCPLQTVVISYAFANVQNFLWKVLVIRWSDAPWLWAFGKFSLSEVSAGE